MAKKRADLIALDPITKELCPAERLPFIYNHNHTGRYDYYITQPEYDGLELIWIDNLPFYAKLKLAGISRTCSGNATADVTDVETGNSYTMYASEFNDAIDRFIDGGILEGCWKFKRKGKQYTLQIAEDPTGDE